jgi:hypothetical protein
MAVSPRPGRTSQDTTSPVVGDRLTRYDLILLAIPVALLASLLAHVAVGVPLRTTLVPASLVGALAIVDAVFLNPPTAGGGEA